MPTSRDGRTDRPRPAGLVRPESFPGPWDVRGRLGAIKGPTLMIVGTYAFACPPSFAHEDGQLSEPCESGHFGHIEQPDEFVAIVSDFVNNQEMGKQT